MEIQEPLYWEISYSDEVATKLQDLSKCIRGNITGEQFLTKHQPSNKFKHTNRLDYEGFVGWFWYGDELDYHKIKTREYYESHNPKNFKILYDIGCNTAAFPEATRVMRFIIQFQKDLLRIYNYVKDPSIIKELMSNLNEGARKACEVSSERKYKIMMSSPTWIEVSKRIFSEVFGLEEFNKQTNGLIKNLINDLQPWSPSSAEDTTKDIVQEMPESMQKFYFYLKKSRNSKQITIT